MIECCQCHHCTAIANLENPVSFRKTNLMFHISELTDRWTKNHMYRIKANRADESSLKTRRLS